MALLQNETAFDSGQLRQARELVLRHGWNATSYQIINPGMEFWFSPTCEAVVGFVRARNTLVVAGAPVCAVGRSLSWAAVAKGLRRSAIHSQLMARPGLMLRACISVRSLPKR